jgi:O-antigen/teichoic acid export membrane protein
VNRLRQFTQGVASSWLATFVTVVYSVLSIPLALSFLSVDEFGLLMLLQQVASYCNLVDFGMTTATARILIDHKDQPRGAEYGAFILAGAAVCLLQAVVVVLAAWLLSPVVIRSFAIAPEYAGVAIHLLHSLGAAFAIGSALRIFNSILYANRRIDLVVLLMSLVPLLGLALMWIVLSQGLGLRGMAWVFVTPALVAGAGAAVAVFWLGLIPARGDWRRPDWAQFQEMFLLGKDMFLITVGNQVLEASQLMIITRTMGLGAAAIWSVSTKLFTLVYQLITKIEGTAIVFFSEMMVRGERSRLELRFRHIYQLTAGLSAVIW